MAWFPIAVHNDGEPITLFALFWGAILLIIIVSEPTIHPIHRVIVHVGKHLRIDLQGDSDMAMPQDIPVHFR